MLTTMNVADADSPRDESTARPSATATEAVAEHATPRGCPFLLSDVGGWRLDLPSRDHRCAAFVPPAPLAPEKQARLCLTAEHTTCATYLASIAAREARLGSTPGDRATRWGLARTTTVIEDPGGLRARLLGIVLDRRRWPAVPAIILVGTLITLGLSGFRADLPSNPVATASPVPTQAPSRAPATPAVTAAPTTASSAPPPSTPPATARSSPAGTPAASFRTYRVKSGDTLSAIAARFGTTVSAIVNLNDLNNPNNLEVGDVILIPNASN
jgi:LysM repeat protein